MTAPASNLRAERLRAIGGAMLAASLFSALASIPAAARAAGGAPFFGSWAMASSLATPLMFAGVLLARGALAGLRSSPATDRDLRAQVVAASAWSVAMLIVMRKLGALLRDRTHHHALAGATFALVSLVAAVGLALAARRLAALLAHRRGRTLATAVAVVAAALYALLQLRAGLAQADPAARAALADAAFIASGAVVATSFPSPGRRAIALGAAAMTAVFAAGVACASPAVADGLGSASPLFGALAGLFRS